MFKTGTLCTKMYEVQVHVPILCTKMYEVQVHVPILC